MNLGVALLARICLCLGPPTVGGDTDSCDSVTDSVDRFRPMDLGADVVVVVDRLNGAVSLCLSITFKNK